MHSGIAITDGIYGNLKPNEVNRLIVNLGQNKSVGQFGEINDILQANPDILQKFIAARDKVRDNNPSLN